MRSSLAAHGRDRLLVFVTSQVRHQRRMGYAETKHEAPAIKFIQAPTGRPGIHATGRSHVLPQVVRDERPLFLVRRPAIELSEWPQLADCSLLRCSTRPAILKRLVNAGADLSGRRYSSDGAGHEATCPVGERCLPGSNFATTVGRQPAAWLARPEPAGAVLRFAGSGRSSSAGSGPPRPRRGRYGIRSSPFAFEFLLYGIR